MSKRKVIRKLLRLRILWAGFFIASVIVVIWYAPKLSEPLPSEPVKIGFIGDSITHGVKNMHSPANRIGLRKGRKLPYARHNTPAAWHALHV